MIKQSNKKEGMPKQKTSKGGRPSKEEKQDCEYEDEGLYIATNDCALKLYQLITEMANYKIITVTGPVGKRNSVTLIKSRKLVEKEQERIRKSVDLDEQYIFFLRDQDKNPRKFVLIEGKLQDEDEEQVDLEKLEHQELLSKDFLNSIKLVCKELNSSMVAVIKEFIHLYLASNKTKEQFQKYCLDEVSKFPQKYKELLEWDRLFEAAYDEKLKLMEMDIDIFIENFKIQETNQQQVKEVEKKRLQVLDKEKKAIQLFKEQQKDHRPLKYMLSRFQQIVHQYYDKSEENN